MTPTLIDSDASGEVVVLDTKTATGRRAARALLRSLAGRPKARGNDPVTYRATCIAAYGPDWAPLAGLFAEPDAELDALAAELHRTWPDWSETTERRFEDRLAMCREAAGYGPWGERLTPLPDGWPRRSFGEHWADVEARRAQAVEAA